MGTVTVTPANGYSRRGMSGYRAVGVAAAPAYDYAALYTALGVPGWVLHGGAGRSDFFEDSAGTVPCTTDDVSPVGRIVDLSGTATHGLQITTANKPVFRVSNGVRFFRSGGSVSTFLDPAIATYTTTAFTFIAVYREITSVANHGALVSNYRGGWGAGGYMVMSEAPAPAQTRMVASAEPTGILATSNGTASPTIMIAERTGLGANQSTISTYNLDGTLIQTVVGTQDANPTNALVIGYKDTDASLMNVAFNMYAAGSLTAQQRADVLADIVSSFAGATL